MNEYTLVLQMLHSLHESMSSRLLQSQSRSHPLKICVDVALPTSLLQYKHMI